MSGKSNFVPNIFIIPIILFDGLRVSLVGLFPTICNEVLDVNYSVTVI
jgi:hypothetical protein